MELPAKSHPVWADIVTGKAHYDLKFMAAKIFIGRCSRLIEEDSSPEMLKSCTEKLHGLYAKNTGNPAAQEDLKTISG
ncbi:hypothetical protein [Fundidesulfovibrio terrae]|uniref:hypothetical protein n=1 Tax=Fundidesulfovibrio terrae TaxID=2922866 RepID=UPI001FB02585|nr:hypothetical protein [Fundidesulfovibrio terrae]